MAKQTWPEEQVVQLIQEVRKRPCVWDPYHVDYNERYNLALAWNDIAQEMLMPVGILRARWKNLRDFYRRELNRPTKSRWRHYKRLKFLKFINPDDGDTHECNESYADYAQEIEANANDPEASTDDLEVSTKKPEVSADAPEVCANEPLVGENRTKVSATESEMKLETQKVNEIYLEVEPIQEEKDNNVDEYDIMFLQSLAPFFEKLELKRKLIVRSRIQDIFLNELAAQQSRDRLNSIL